MEKENMIFETEHFCVFAEAGQEENARHFGELLEREYIKICSDFQFLHRKGGLSGQTENVEGMIAAGTENKFRCFLCGSTQEYIRRTGKKEEEYQDWMVGCSDRAGRKICLLAPEAAQGITPTELERVALHELVHLVFDDYCGAVENEAWLCEGIAILYAGQTDLRYVSEDDFPRIAELGGRCTDEETPDEFVDNGGYDYAGIYVWYFIKLFGFETFLAAYRNEQEASKLLPEGFEREAIQSFLRTYVVRRLTVPELPVLTELFHYNDVGQMLAETAEILERGEEDIFALYREERLLGELHVKYVSEDEREAVCGRRAYLFAFRVRREEQGRGLGTLLLKKVLEELAGLGYTEFTIGVEDDNVLAKHIYEKFGFDRVIARKQESYQGDSYEYDLLLKEALGKTE